MSTARAKRGDLIAVIETTRTTSVSGPPTERERVTVGIVTSITRDGAVKVWEDAQYRTPHKMVDGTRRLIMSADLIDVPAALATAKANPWPHAPEHKGKPYDSVDECREAMRPHLFADLSPEAIA